MDDLRRIALVETKTADAGSIDPEPLNTPRFPYQLTSHLDSAVMEVDEDASIISQQVPVQPWPSPSTR